MSVGPEEWMALCLVTEDNEPHAYQYLGWVIRNRLASKRYPNTVREVVLQEEQFSKFNSLASHEREHWSFMEIAEKVLNNQWIVYQEVKEDERMGLWGDALAAAEAVLNSRRNTSPFSNRVLHFYAPRSMKPVGSKPPWWDKEIATTINLPNLPRWVFGESK